CPALFKDRLARRTQGPGRRSRLALFPDRYPDFQPAQPGPRIELFVIELEQRLVAVGLAWARGQVLAPDRLHRLSQLGNMAPVAGRQVALPRQPGHPGPARRLAWVAARDGDRIAEASRGLVVLVAQSVPKPWPLAQRSLMGLEIGPLRG